MSQPRLGFHVYLGRSSGTTGTQLGNEPDLDQGSNSNDSSMDPSATSSLSQPVYQPLQSDPREFRVLLLRPGQYPDRLRGNLIITSFDEHPAYETMSYCWGDATETSSIELDGVCTEVPATAVAALKRIRVSYAGRLLWIDSVCINQNDHVERAQQVQMMDLIYSKSSRNIIYLGEGLSCSAAIMYSLVALYWDAKQSTDNFTKLDGTCLEVNPSKETLWTQLVCKKTTRGCPPEVDTAALKSFFLLPWFRRLWVFQESVLAPFNTCYFGSYAFSLLLVVRAAKWLMGGTIDKAELGHLLINNICFIAGEGIETRSGCGGKYPGKWLIPNFEGLLERSKYLLATDPRDLVYGMLGIELIAAKGALHPLLSPDYTKPVEAVFRDATRYLLQERGHDRAWLNIHWDDEDELENSTMPSWVIDWTRLGGVGAATKDSPTPQVSDWSRFMALKTFSRDLVFANASCIGSCSGNIVFLEDDVNVILAGGFRIGEITDMTSVLTDDTASEGYSNHKRLWLEDFIDAVCAKLRPEEVEDRLSSILTALDKGVALSDEERLQAMAELIDQAGLGGKYPSRPPMWADVPEQRAELILKFDKALQYSCFRRRVFLTAVGHLGIGPPVLRRNDVVVVFYGFNAPYILRPAGQDYRIVGACHVDGIMQGEAMGQHKSNGDPDTVFRIR